jgi:hypothetical protein
MEKIKLAIIDDNHLFLNALTEVLISYDLFEVIIVSKNFLELLNLLKEEEPHIILMDTGVFEKIDEYVRDGFLKLISTSAFVLMGFKIPKLMQAYKKNHSGMRFLSKDSSRYIIAYTLIDLMDHLDSYHTQ